MALATMELDPVFRRALKLLHSKSKDSTVQLRTMMEEAIRHRKGLGPGPTGSPIASPQHHVTSFPISSGNGNGKTNKKESEKRSLDRLKDELSGLVPKRPRLDSPRSSGGGFSSKSHTPSPTPPGSSRGEGDKQSSSEEAEDFDLEINLEGLNDCTCCVCNSFNQENGNKLMECHTCQNLYHQECHLPVVSNEDANDPRLVWNCSKCEIKSPIPSKPNKPVLGSGSLPKASSSAASASSLTLSGSVKGSGASRASPAKTSGKTSGMAALAASFKSTSSKSLQSSNSRYGNTASMSGSNGNGSGGKTQDKRLQMMKKKVGAGGRKIK